MTKIVLIVGASAGMFVGCLGPELVAVIFRMDDPLFRIMLPALGTGVFFYFWAASPGAVLTTDGHVMAKLRIQAVTAVTSLVLNVLLVPRFGALAAAFVFALSNLLLVIQYSREVGKHSPSRGESTLKQAIGIATYLAVAVTANMLVLQRSFLVKTGIWLVTAAAGVVMLWLLWLSREERQVLSDLAFRGTFLSNCAP